jgi:hypothetical protein
MLVAIHLDQHFGAFQLEIILQRLLTASHKIWKRHLALDLKVERLDGGIGSDLEKRIEAIVGAWDSSLLMDLFGAETSIRYE